MDPYVTVRDVFEGMPDPDADHDLPNHDPVRQQEQTTERMREADWGDQLHESWTEKVRLHPERPAPTMKAGKRPNYHFAHPFEPRKLTVRERAQLQSFERDVTFVGGLIAGRRQTGNAVPPALAESIADGLDVRTDTSNRR